MKEREEREIFFSSYVKNLLILYHNIKAFNTKQDVCPQALYKQQGEGNK